MCMYKSNCGGDLNMDMPVIVKEKTCFFAGHRPYKFTYLPEEEEEFYSKLSADITNAVQDMYNKGCDTFLCGGSIGFDVMCGEAVIEFKNQHPEVRLVCVLPFENHHEEFSPEWKNRFTKVLDACDFIDYFSPIYVMGCYYDRHQKMIDNSEYMITYFDGKSGGTARVIAAAQSAKLKITNLFEDPPVPENITFFVGYDYNDQTKTSSNKPNVIKK